MNKVLFLINTSVYSQDMWEYEANQGLICLVNSLIMLGNESIQIATYGGDSDVEISELIVPSAGHTVERIREFCNTMDFCSAPTTKECYDLVSDWDPSVCIYICDANASPTWIAGLENTYAEVHAFDSFIDMTNYIVDLDGIRKVFIDEFEGRNLDKGYSVFKLLENALKNDFQNLGWCRNLTYAWELLITNRQMLTPQMHWTFLQAEQQGTQGDWLDEIGHECELTRQYIAKFTLDRKAKCIVYDGPNVDSWHFIDLIWGNEVYYEAETEIRDYMNCLRIITVRDVVKGQAYIPLDAGLNFIWANILYILDPIGDLSGLDSTRILQPTGAKQMALLAARCSVFEIARLGREFLASWV